MTTPTLPSARSVLRATSGIGCVLALGLALILCCALAIVLWWALLKYGPGI
jgi:hypothetical protein